MGAEARTQDGKTFALSALKSAFCILPWRVLLRNRRIWPLWSWLRGCKKRTIAAMFSRKEAVMPVNFCVSPHKLMPIWRAEKPRFTSWPVRPFTSLEAAQSSRTMSVLVRSKRQLTIFNQISTSCCVHTITNIRGSFSPKRCRQTITM